MNLSTAQKATVKTWLDANQVGTPEQAAADALNALAVPNYLAWMSVTKRLDINAATGFDWTRIDNLSVGKARIWDWMFNAVDYINPWRGNVRAGINAVWVGTQADLDVRTAVIGACQRPVTVFEKLFVTLVADGPVQSGARGSVTNADKLGLDAAGVFIEGKITVQQVSDIRGGL